MNTITISREAYQDLIDARDHAVAMRGIEAGEIPVLGEVDAAAFLEASSPLAFWRKKRGKSQTELARELELSQPYLAQLESGKRVGDVRLYARIARALGVRIEDLLED